jgi:hypothetical protein
MAITPTYSWPLPDNDDLVKDGAEAIRDLGNAIDTTVGGLSGAGLVHIETETGTSVSGITVNDCFSADYDHYRIIINWDQASSTAAAVRLRASGSDLSTATYDRLTVGLSGTYAAFQGTGLTSWPLSYFNTTGLISYSIDLFSPFLTEEKRFHSLSGLSNVMTNSQGKNTTATSFTGITAFVGSGNITGTLSVYGYRK